MNSSSGSHLRVRFNYADLMSDFTVDNLIGDFTGPLSNLLAQPFEKPLRIFEVTIENTLAIYLTFTSSLTEEQEGLLTLEVESHFLHPIRHGKPAPAPLRYQPAATLQLASGILTLFENEGLNGKEERESSVEEDFQGYVPIRKTYPLFEYQDGEYQKYLVRSIYLNIMTLLLQLKKGYTSYNPLVSFKQLTDISSRVGSFFEFFEALQVVPILYRQVGRFFLSEVIQAKYFRLLVKDPGPTGMALVQCVISESKNYRAVTNYAVGGLSLDVFCKQSTKLFPKDNPATRSLLNPLMGPFKSQNRINMLNLQYHSCQDPNTYHFHAPLRDSESSPTYEVMSPEPLTAAGEEENEEQEQEQGSYLPQILTKSKDFIGLLVSFSDLIKLPEFWVEDHSTFPDCEDLPLIYLRLASGKPSALYRFGFNLPHHDPQIQQLANSVEHTVRSSSILRKLASVVVPNSRRARRGFCRYFKAELYSVLPREIREEYEDIPLGRIPNMEMTQRFISNWAVDLP